jgi:hypothetical protein
MTEFPMDRPVTLTTSPMQDARSGVRWQRIDLDETSWISIYENGVVHVHGRIVADFRR